MSSSAKSNHSTKRSNGFWSDVWHWLRALDAAMNRDPVQQLKSKVSSIENRLQELETELGRIRDTKNDQI